MPDGGIFDPEFYAATSPDVVNAVGNSTEALYNHYLTFGIKEGRLPYASAANASVEATKEASATAPITKEHGPQIWFLHVRLLPTLFKILYMGLQKSISRM